MRYHTSQKSQTFPDHDGFPVDGTGDYTLLREVNVSFGNSAEGAIEVGFGQGAGAGGGGLFCIDPLEYSEHFSCLCCVSLLLANYKLCTCTHISTISGSCFKCGEHNYHFIQLVLD